MAHIGTVAERERAGFGGDRRPAVEAVREIAVLDMARPNLHAIHLREAFRAALNAVVAEHGACEPEEILVARRRGERGSSHLGEVRIGREDAEHFGIERAHVGAGGMPACPAANHHPAVEKVEESRRCRRNELAHRLELPLGERDRPVEIRPGLGRAVVHLSQHLTPSVAGVDVCRKLGYVEMRITVQGVRSVVEENVDLSPLRVRVPPDLGRIRL